MTLTILRDLGITQAATLIVHELLCAALFYAAFCRAVRSDATVRPEIRWGFNMLGAAACAGLAAPITGWQPDVMHIVMLAPIVWVQAMTARFWRAGPPAQFVRPQFRQASRRAGDCA